jgi:hypothetical protein
MDYLPLAEHEQHQRNKPRLEQRLGILLGLDYSEPLLEEFFERLQVGRPDPMPLAFGELRRCQDLLYVRSGAPPK